jgi:hypothetical protein
LADSRDIADPEVLFGANGEDGFEDAGQRLIRV